MYRAVLLCACLLLVATPVAFSASPAANDVDAAKAAAAPGVNAAHIDAARQLEREKQAAATSTGAAGADKKDASIAVAAGLWGRGAAATAASKAKAAAAAPAAAPKAATAAAAPSAAGQQQKPQSKDAPAQLQQQQQQAQLKPAALPTIAQPAAPPPLGASQPSAAVQPQAQRPAAASGPAQGAQQQLQPQPQLKLEQQQQLPESQAELLSSNEQAVPDVVVEAKFMYSEPGTVNYYTKRSGVQPPNHDPHHAIIKPGQYSSGFKSPGHSYGSKTPGQSYSSHGSYSEGDKSGSYSGTGHYNYDPKHDDKHDHNHKFDDRWANYDHKLKYGDDKYDKYDYKHDDQWDHKHDDKYDDKKYDDKYDSKHDGKRDDIIKHHTGKAAKKLYKSKEGDKYLSDDHHSHNSYSRDSYDAHRHSSTEQAVTQEDSNTQQQGSLATGLQQAADKEKMLKLQKYYQAEADLLAAELEDDSVSSFARPSKYGNKAAKYAAMALKAQGVVPSKPAAGQPAAQVQTQIEAKPGLAGLAAAFMKKKPATDKTTVLFVPKPTIKGVAGNAQTLSEDPLGEEISYEEYMANPQLYAGIPYGDSEAKEGVMVITHEQYHKGGKKHGKKAQAQAQKQALSIDMTGGAVGTYAPVPDTAAQLQGRPSSGPEHYYQDGKKGKKDGYYPDPYGGGYYDPYSGGPREFDMDHNYQPPLRKKEAKNVYNFRAVHGTESTTLGYTKGPGRADLDSTDRPVVIAYTSKMTCGNGPSIGTCTGTGIMPSPTPATQSTMMSFTCTIDADASNICGLKYIQGMTVTAQGLVTTTIDADDEDTLCSLSADVLPITGVYVPGRRTTLLADVVSLLSGVKGGSLMLRSDGNSDGHFSFYFWR